MMEIGYGEIILDHITSLSSEGIVILNEGKDGD